jgi:lipoprotein-anchoring transpeptidase ErfK/SrfK
MKKLGSGSVIVVLSCLLIILFSWLFVRRDREKEVRQNTLPSDLSGNVDPEKKMGYWHGEKVEIPAYIFDLENKKVLSVVPKEDRWIEVDLSEQKLYAWENGEIFLESLVSTGLPWWPTPEGEFTIWLKSRAVTMEGGEGKYYYNLPNVPYVMFFQNDDLPKALGYGLHGTYWHNDFGKVHSHGCVNLPTSIAKELYYWTYPILSNDQKSVYSADDNPGTKIIIHG